MISETSLADLAKLYNYESSRFQELIKKVDNIVEALTLSQAVCSGMQEIEDAKYDFRKLRQSLQKILEHINQSKDMVHKSYFNFTKTLVKEYLLKNVETIKDKYSGILNIELDKGNIEVGKDVFTFLQAKYNYGLLYIVGVSRDNWIYKDDMTHYGNLQEGRSYTVQHDGISIIIFQAPSLCDTYNDPEDNFINSLSNKCAKGDSLSGMYKSKCGDEFTCAYTPQCDIFGISYSRNGNDIFISNGGICRILSNLVRTIIMRPFTSNYTYMPMELGTPIIFDLINKTNYNKKPFSPHFAPVKFLKSEILFVEEILRLPEIEFTEKLIDCESLKNELTSKDEGQKYTNFKAGYNYIFYGKIICENENPIGENAITSLIEVDEFSSDDVITVASVDSNGDFMVKVDSNYNDFPSSTLELKLKFKNCCGYSDQFSGNLKNGTTNEYTLSDEGVKFGELL
uniref:Uncharacterized protein n=1 Tax=Panagrolaimus sp. ES5 TaxID=591445 RepID=A0AC34FN13_9BILA